MKKTILTAPVALKYILSFLLICTVVVAELAAQNKTKTIYDYTVTTIDGEEFALSALKGKKIMIVNVASACGLTPQYEQLQTIYETYQHKDFIVLGFPSNDFAEQEKGSNDEIKSFCTLNYGVTFPMMSKISVKGDKKSPLYKWLTSKELNRKDDYDVTWNFQKFLINQDGSLHKSISPKTRPDDPEIIKWISE